MMLAHPQIDTVFDFDADKVNTLVIEHPHFFREFLRDIDAQLHGGAGDTVLSKQYEPISISGNAELIESFLTFDINRKTLIAKLLSQIESIAMDETHYYRTMTLIGDLEQYIQELSMDLTNELSCSKMSFGTVLRAVGIGIPDHYENDLERILDYMELSRELERDKLFIFVNLRSFYADDEVELFLTSVLAHEYHIFLIDSVSRALLPNEKRITVDNDLCEF